jgi:integrase
MSRGQKRNWYTPWMRDAFIISRFTGLRREEICNLKWENILEVEGTKFFHIVDLKTTRQKRRTYLKVAPITNELSYYLEEIRSNSESDFIINSGLKESTFKDKMTRSFTHFYKVANLNVPQKTFKQLRKSHITELKSILGDDAYLASGHSGNPVIEKHYIDQIAAVTKYSKFKNRMKADLQLN